MKKLLLLCLLLLPFSSYAIQIDWEKTIWKSGGQDRPIDWKSTTDTGKIVFGKSVSKSAQYFFFVKLNQKDDTVWTSKFQPDSLFSVPAEIVEMQDHNFLIAGFTNDSANAKWHSWLICLDGKTGQRRWAKNYYHWPRAGFAGLWPLSNGDFIVRLSANTANFQSRLISLSAKGDTMWSIIASPDRVLAINDSFYTVTDKDYTKYTNTGKLINSKNLSYLPTYTNDFIKLRDNKSYLVAGTQYFAKLNLNLDTIWTKRTKQISQVNFTDKSTIQTFDGGFLQFLHYSSPLNQGVSFMKMDSECNIQDWPMIVEYDFYNGNPTIRNSYEKLLLNCDRTFSLLTEELNDTSKQRLTKTVRISGIKNVYGPCITTALQESSTIPMEISLYPNPVTQTLYATLPPNLDGYFSLYNTQGKKLGIYPDSALSSGINISAFPAGMYFIKYEDGEYLQGWKIIKK